MQLDNLFKLIVTNTLSSHHFWIIRASFVTNVVCPFWICQMLPLIFKTSPALFAWLTSSKRELTSQSVFPRFLNETNNFAENRNSFAFFLPQESILTLINFLLQKLEIIVIVVKVINKFYIEIQNQMKRHLPIWSLTVCWACAITVSTLNSLCTKFVGFDITGWVETGGTNVTGVSVPGVYIAVLGTWWVLCLLLLRKGLP